MRRVLVSLAASALACNPAPFAPRTMPSSWVLPVEVREEPAFQALVLPVRGSYARQDAAMARLHEELRRYGVTPLGPPFTRYLNDPAQAAEEELRWEVGVAVLPGTGVHPPLELRSLGSQLVVSARSRGPFEESARQWPALTDWIVAHGYQPLGEAMMFWSSPGRGSGDDRPETELRQPVVKIAAIPLLLRDLVCVGGLALLAVFLASRLGGSAGRAPLRGGALWGLLGSACAVTYLQPLVGDLGYLYGDLLSPPRAARFLAVRDAMGAAGAMVAPLVVHLLFRLMRARLPARRAVGGAVASLYLVSFVPRGLLLLGAAPPWLVRAELGALGVARIVAAALLIAAMVAGDRGPYARAERITYLVLAALGAAAACAALLPLAVVRGIAAAVVLAIPIPFLVATSYFHERTALFDVVAKRGAFAVAALLALTAYFAIVPGWLWSARMGWVGSWVLPVSALPFVLLAPWISGWLSARLDRHWLGRVLSPAQAQRLFLGAVGGAATEEELLRAAEDQLAAIFPAGRPRDPRRRAVRVTLGEDGGDPAERLEAPLVVRGERVGTLAIATPPEARPLLSEDRALLGSLAEALGLALEALRLRERKLAQERAEQELRLLATRAELKALRAQINPHFLFNALNSIAELVASDPIRAERTVERLAEVLRHALRGSEAEWVSVDDELALVRAYLEVEGIRFGARLVHRIDVGDGAGAALVPAMVVQTLVENAVKHGIAPSPGPGRVEVAAVRSDGRLRIEVRDSGPGFPPGAGEDGAGTPGPGLGLRNVRERLERYFGDEGQLRVGRDAATGTTSVAIAIPALSRPPGPAREAR